MQRILIVEDEVDVAAVLRKRLSDAGFEVFVAGDGYIGTKMAHEKDPDLIVLDLMLPAGHGLIVLNNLRLSAETAAIPVIVVTGMEDEEYAEQVRKKGVAGFFGKPYDTEELIRTIRQVLQKG